VQAQRRHRIEYVHMMRHRRAAADTARGVSRLATVNNTNRPCASASSAAPRTSRRRCCGISPRRWPQGGDR
jgi:hypothetical protein